MKISNMRTLKCSYLIIFGAFVGIIAGRLLWELMPVKGVIDADTTYTLVIGKAEELRQKNNTAQAESVLKYAISLNPNRYEGYLDLGDLLLSRSETNAALTNYDAALLYCGHSPTNLLSIEDQVKERGLIIKKIHKIRIDN